MNAKKPLKMLTRIALFCGSLLIITALVWIYTDPAYKPVFSESSDLGVKINLYYQPEEVSAMDPSDAYPGDAQRINFLRIQELYFASRAVSAPYSGPRFQGTPGPHLVAYGGEGRCPICGTKGEHLTNLTYFPAGHETDVYIQVPEIKLYRCPKDGNLFTAPKRDRIQ